MMNRPPLEERYRNLVVEHRKLQNNYKTLELSVKSELTTDDRSWLQIKIDGQRKALDTLNRKVLTQRFRLRTLNEMGRDLTKKEYLAARDALQNEQVKERIEDYATIT